ncbi:HEAT repeat domain-containing protein [Rubrivivax gelatinosus]|uniref:HEAT repeat protein n=1 Tax=Rubrivivax gelatinosus TaxID=28068 RepID=A0A4R2MTM0_RUBGE|nr:HEAT repeat domain-containing protein [Rubrivivax gelatinosus]TCP02843.1 HEAT repeat protein [Rubrivivax gelatinosus]
MALKKPGDPSTLRPIETREYPRDLAGLLAQLGDPDSSRRRWAARDLAAHPAAAAAVCARLAVETEASVRAVLFSTATHLGSPEVVQAMIELLRSEDPALRNGAIEVLASLPGAVAEHVDRLLADSDGDVRIFTVNLLGELRHPQVPAWLNQVLLHEAQVNVVGAALEVLSELGGPENLPALQQVRRRFAADAYIDFCVGLALERIEAA